MADLDIPQLLKKAYEKKELAVFVGSGLSLGKDVKGGFPKWEEVGPRLLAYADTKVGLTNDQERDAVQMMFDSFPSLEKLLANLDTVKELLEDHYGRALKSLFRPDGACPGKAHQAICDLGVQAVLTTNYDQLLELAFGGDYQVHTWKHAIDADEDLQSGSSVLFKVHGTIEHPKSIVLTRREYDGLENDGSYRPVLTYLLKKNCFLFVGYGMNDPFDLDRILKGNQEAFKRSNRDHFALLPESTVSTQEVEKYRRDYKVRIIPYRNHDEVVPFLQLLKNGFPAQNDWSSISARDLAHPSHRQGLENWIKYRLVAVLDKNIELSKHLYQQVEQLAPDIPADAAKLGESLLKTGFQEVWRKVAPNLSMFKGCNQDLQKVLFLLAQYSCEGEVVEEIKEILKQNKENGRFVVKVLASKRCVELGQLILKTAMKQELPEGQHLGSQLAKPLESGMTLEKKKIDVAQHLLNKFDLIEGDNHCDEDILSRLDDLREELEGHFISNEMLYISHEGKEAIGIPFLFEFLQIKNSSDSGESMDGDDLDDKKLIKALTQNDILIYRLIDFVVKKTGN